MNFADRLKDIAEWTDRIVLREKDLSENEYRQVAEKAFAVCGEKLVIHNFPNVAKQLRIHQIHLPLPILRTLSAEDKIYFTEIGTSCHSVEDAKEAIELGCTYIFAGHIFETDCKKGLPGRGLEFLKGITEKSSIPVYAIGGISDHNISDVLSTGADGICVMSGLMSCEDVEEYIQKLKGGASYEI